MVITRVCRSDTWLPFAVPAQADTTDTESGLLSYYGTTDLYSYKKIVLLLRTQSHM